MSAKLHTLVYLVGPLLLLLCFTPQQSLCMAGDLKSPSSPSHPLRSNTPPLSPSHHHASSSSSSSSPASSSGPIVPKHIEEAILSGSREAVEKLKLSKKELKAYYKQLQYIVGVQVGQPLPKRCYDNDNDKGMFIRPSGQVDLRRSMIGGHLASTRNVVEAMDALPVPPQRSLVKELVTVCGVQMPVTENNHLILRQPTYSSCGASAALMIAYDHKCKHLERLCHKPSECREGVPMQSVRALLAEACPQFDARTKIFKKRKHGDVLDLTPEKLLKDVDYVILYYNHFMILRRVGADQYILRESFCAAEYTIDGELADTYLSQSVDVLPVVM